ncbi:MAG TPA: dihydropteroate synthase [Desulfomonilaceae bacterium]|nr:dihydropteroate synthase [Desulfomonilaceae bacterium]HVN77696.1 dihydropteroate synthase [Terriglobia bacterium]
MGVLNVTPDSFFDGGHYFKPEQAIDRGIRLEDEGADILDIGGESTRPPHVVELPFEEETRRILPVIEGLRKRLRIPISVDTYKAAVARRAIAAGAEMVNDVGGLRFDGNLASVVAETKAAVVIVHSRGSPTTMHGLPPSSGIVRLVVSGLRARIRKARKAGIPLSRIVIDPGIGFGKQPHESLKLLHNLNSLRQLKLPILVGVSRKSFLGQILRQPVESRLIGSLAAASVAVVEGAHILRVHDVKETVQVLKICDAILRGNV